MEEFQTILVKQRAKLLQPWKLKKKKMQLKVTCHKFFLNVFVSDLLIELNKKF
jgi:hypothetical protein